MIELKGKTERWREGGSSRWLGNGCHLQLLIGRVKPSACSVVVPPTSPRKRLLAYEPLSSRLRFHPPPPPQLSNRSLSRCVFVDKISKTESVEFFRNENHGGGEMIVEKGAKFVNVGESDFKQSNQSWNDDFREIMLRHRIIFFFFFKNSSIR